MNDFFTKYDLANVYVDSNCKDKALEILKTRIENGEDPYDIVKIDHTSKYYLNKILNGLIPISMLMYKNITGEDGTPDKYLKSYTCINCGRHIVAKYSMYCKECYKKLYGKYAAPARFK